MALSILEAAANVRQQKAELDDILRKLRSAGAEWTGYSIAAEDTMKIADDGLHNCRMMIDRIRALALSELQRCAA